jgi:hypothetical protein
MSAAKIFNKCTLHHTLQLWIRANHRLSPSCCVFRRLHQEVCSIERCCSLLKNPEWARGASYPYSRIHIAELISRQATAPSSVSMARLSTMPAFPAEFKHPHCPTLAPMNGQLKPCLKHRRSSRKNSRSAVHMDHRCVTIDARPPAVRVISSRHFSVSRAGPPKRRRTGLARWTHSVATFLTRAATEI